MDNRDLADKLGRVAALFQVAALALYADDLEGFQKPYDEGLSRLDGFQDAKDSVLK